MRRWRYRQALKLSFPWLWGVTLPWGRDIVQINDVKSNVGYVYMENAVKLAARYFLAECLIEMGEADEAAEILRGLVRENGDKTVDLCLNSNQCNQGDFIVVQMKIGSQALGLLRKLHAQIPGENQRRN